MKRVTPSVPDFVKPPGSFEVALFYHASDLHSRAVMPVYRSSHLTLSTARMVSRSEAGGSAVLRML